MTNQALTGSINFTCTSKMLSDDQVSAIRTNSRIYACPDSNWVKKPTAARAAEDMQLEVEAPAEERPTKIVTREVTS